ncbi:MAG: hypothetical protein RL557_578 [archaeon]|jgi:hypothetical protein
MSDPLHPDFNPMEHYQDTHEHDTNYDFEFQAREEDLFEKDNTHNSQLIQQLKRKHPR